MKITLLHSATQPDFRVRDWSLITGERGGGGLQNGRGWGGEACEVLPLRKGVVEKF